jgi:hypothetical protein
MLESGQHFLVLFFVSKAILITNQCDAVIANRAFRDTIR